MPSLRRSCRAVRLVLICSAGLLFGVGLLLAQRPPPQAGRGQGPPGPGRGIQKPTKKQVLVWGEMTGGGAYHESVNNAMVTVYKLGKETGLFDTYLRTDSQFITKQRLTVNADGRDWPVGRNLDWFDAVFFYGQREIPLTQQQMTDLITFVKDDGKGFVAVHTAFNAFQRFPEFGEMLGARYDGHPWGNVEAPVVVLDRTFPAMKALPPVFTFRDEFIQVKDFSWDNARVLMNLETAKLDMANQNVHREANDFPQAWARLHGKGRVFVCGLGHDSASWDRPDIQTMWLEAIKWALGLTEADVTPRPKPGTK